MYAFDIQCNSSVKLIKGKLQQNQIVLHGYFSFFSLHSMRKVLCVVRMCCQLITFNSICFDEGLTLETSALATAVNLPSST